MKCQNCGKDTLGVIKTEKFDTLTRRILACKACGWSGTTVEEFMAVKKQKSGQIAMPQSA